MEFLTTDIKYIHMLFLINFIRSYTITYSLGGARGLTVRHNKNSEEERSMLSLARREI